jgi:hypothetical protein
VDEAESEEEPIIENAMHCTRPEVALDLSVLK